MPQIADKMDGIEFTVDPFIRAIPLTEKIDDKSLGAKHSQNDKIVSDLLSKGVQRQKDSVSAKAKVNQKKFPIKSYNDPKYARMIKEINYNLVQKLSKGLLLRSKKILIRKTIPWQQLKQDDLINWPNDIPLDRMGQLGRQRLVKLHSILDRIDFTKEFLDHFAKSKDDPKYLTKEIQDNLVQKLNNGLLLRSKKGLIRNTIPWQQLKQDDLINWPNDVPLDSIKLLGKKSLVKLYSILDRVDFTKEFLDQFALGKDGRKDLVKEIYDNLGQKLNNGLMLRSKQARQHIPWEQLKREDFINWPNDVPLDRIHRLGKQSLVKLFRNLENIDFTKEFLDHFAIGKDDRKKVSLRVYNDPKCIRMIKKINYNLVQKLNNGLLLRSNKGLMRMKIPWKELKREDVINWPNDVPLDRMIRLGKRSLVKLYRNLESIDFTEEFLDRYAKLRPIITQDFLEKHQASNSVH